MAIKITNTRGLQSRLKLQYLQVVAALDETRSVTRAAERLHITRAALSKTLAAVEDSLGVELYERTGTGLLPTPYGVALARHARVILGDLLSAEEELGEISAERNERLAVGAFFTAMPALLPQALARLARTAPRSVVTVREGNMFELLGGLRDGDFDLIVGRVMQDFVQQEVAVVGLYEEDMHAVCRAGHPLAHGRPVSWRDACAHPWILPPKESPMRRSFQARLRDEGVAPPAVIVEAMSVPFTFGLLASSETIAIMSTYATRAAMANGGFATLPLEVPPLPAPMGIAWRRDRPQSPLAASLIEALQACSPPCIGSSPATA